MNNAERFGHVPWESSKLRVQVVAESDQDSYGALTHPNVQGVPRRNEAQSQNIVQPPTGCEKSTVWNSIGIYKDNGEGPSGGSEIFEQQSKAPARGLAARQRHSGTSVTGNWTPTIAQHLAGGQKQLEYRKRRPPKAHPNNGANSSRWESLQVAS